MEILRNPYLNRSMIKEPQEFYGRGREITRIYSRLSAPHPQCISIVGDRRIGKSSLLNYIYHEANRAKYLRQPEDFVFVFSDLQAERVGTLSDFFDHFFEFLDDALEGQIAVEETPGYNGLRQLVTRLARRHLKLIILFDEFDAITKNQNFDPEFFSFFRSIANRYDVAYILSSGSELQQLCHTKEIAESPFFNIFSRLPLGPLTRAEAQQLICEPSREAGYNLQNHADFLIDFAGYFPFFLQIACSAFFDYLLDYPDIEAPDLTEIANLFHQEADQHFRFLWEHFDPLHRTTIHVILEDGEIEPKQGDALMKLHRDGYLIENDGKYRLFSSGFAEYLRINEPQLEEAPTVVADAAMQSRQTEPGDREYTPEAIMVVDVCGSTHIAHLYGDHLLGSLYKRLEDFVLDVAHKFGLRYRISTGDGWLLTFGTVLDAVCASLEIQACTQTYNATADKMHHLPIRFSIHFGETLTNEAGHRYGAAVNMAFKVEGLSDVLEGSVPKENYILVTEQVARELTDFPGLHCNELGAFELAGFTGLHRVYELRRGE